MLQLVRVSTGESIADYDWDFEERPPFEAMSNAHDWFGLESANPMFSKSDLVWKSDRMTRRWMDVWALQEGSLFIAATTPPEHKSHFRGVEVEVVG